MRQSKTPCSSNTNGNHKWIELSDQPKHNCQMGLNDVQCYLCVGGRSYATHRCVRCNKMACGAYLITSAVMKWDKQVANKPIHKAPVKSAVTMPIPKEMIQ